MKYILSLFLFSSCVVIHIQPKEKIVKEPVLQTLTDTTLRGGIPWVFRGSELKVDSTGCPHRFSSVTLMYCPDGVQCNTATCSSCGYKWKTN